MALVFGFVDDFKIHGATKGDCIQATTDFMNLMVRLGLICQKAKTVPPSQVQKYCGFIYDTRGSPTLLIPPHKISRCIANAEYLLNRPRSQAVSRLSLAIVTGVLQSVVDATPQHIGQSYLRALYDDLHRWEEVGHLEGTAKFFTVVELSEGGKEGLRWWIQHLRHSSGATTCRASARRGLVMKWGDGSGTGTGGTTELYRVAAGQEANPGVELWMGVWKTRAAERSSNWKEARTVLESLLLERGSERIRETTVFYFTDNLVSYYIINGGSSRSPELHHLVQEIKEVCQHLGCRLEVVHVPGTLMILQGTDGLSRGVWLAPERRMSEINQLVFEPVFMSPSLCEWASALVSARPGKPQDYATIGSFRHIQGCLTVWNPPPECARQVLGTYLRRWVQCFEDSEAVFLIPRILQKQWGHMSRYIREVGVFQSGLLPVSCRFVSHLPFVVLHIPVHSHSLRPRRMDQAPPAQPKGWHKRQAEEVCRLS